MCHLLPLLVLVLAISLVLAFAVLVSRPSGFSLSLSCLPWGEVQRISFLEKSGVTLHFQRSNA